MAGRYPSIAEQDTASKVVQLPGTEQHKEISDEEAKNVAIQSRPRGMSSFEQEVWDSDIPEFAKINRFKKHFKEFYKQYCIVVSRMEKTKQKLDKQGWTYQTEGRNGTQHKSHPDVAQYNDDFRKLNSLINQIGASPATDQRFHNLQPDLFEELY